VTTGSVRRERHDGVEVLTLDRPEARNALDPATADALETALNDCDADASVRAVILTGTGPAFCAGADLAAVARGDGALLFRPIGGFGGVVRHPIQKVLIAAVNGPAVGGGFELVLACDLVVMAEHAVLGLPEVKRGLIATGGGLLRLPRRVPRAVAMEMITTGDPITAGRALELGLANRVCPATEVLAEAMALAARVGANGPAAVRTSRRIVRATADLPEEDGWELQAEAAAVLAAGPEAREGVDAFLHKREPRWS
jgi:enoyl-CoA hydratase